MKTVQFPGGPTSQESQVVGVIRQVRVDTSRNEMVLHDGVTPGGHRIPNVDTIAQMIADVGSETEAADVQFYGTEAELQAAPVSASTLAVVSSDGKDDVFVWRLTGDTACVVSSIQGFWHRLDAPVGFFIRLYRAGLIYMQINGAAPTVNKDITVWLDAGTPKIWDGSNYLVVTPVLWGRLLAQVGGYYSGTVSLPNRLAAQETDVTDCNTVTQSGWYRTTVSAANSPLAGMQSFEHREMDGTTAYQQMQKQAGGGDFYIRYRAASVWGSWQLSLGQIPAGLTDYGVAQTDCDNATAIGLFTFLSSATHSPEAVAGTIIAYPRTASTDVGQIWYGANGKIWTRNRIANTFGSWILVLDPTTAALHIANPTHAATSKASPVDADEIPIADSASSFSLKKVTLANLKAFFKVLYDATYLSLTGGTVSGSLNVAGNLNIGPGIIVETGSGHNLAAPANGSIDYTFFRAVISRWSLRFGDGNDTGANVGSNIRFRSFDDAGAPLSDVLVLTRVGDATFARDVSIGRNVLITGTLGVTGLLSAVNAAISGTLAVVGILTTTAQAAFSGGFTAAANAFITGTSNGLYMDQPAAGGTNVLSFRRSGSIRWFILGTNGADGGGNTGADLQFQGYDNAGAFLVNAHIMTRLGDMTHARDLAVGRNSAVTGNETVGGTFGVTGLSTVAAVNASGDIVQSGAKKIQSGSTGLFDGANRAYSLSNPPPGGPFIAQNGFGDAFFPVGLPVAAWLIAGSCVAGATTPGSNINIGGSATGVNPQTGTWKNVSTVTISTGVTAVAVRTI